MRTKVTEALMRIAPITAWIMVVRALLNSSVFPCAMIMRMPEIVTTNARITFRNVRIMRTALRKSPPMMKSLVTPCP